jgi:hypothetical protein
MSKLIRHSIAALACVVVSSAAVRAADEAKPAAAKVTFDEHVQPIFREHCLSCHNQNEAKSDLALDTYTRTMQGGAGGEVVVAGDLESSRLYALVAHIESPKMPPEQDRIAAAKVELLKQWILGGALENTGSKAKIKPKVDLTLAVSSGNKPEKPAMPEKMWRQPFVAAVRPGASTAIAASPWAPLVAVAGQKQVMLYDADSLSLLTILSFPEGTPHVLKFSRDGSVLLVGGGRGGASGKVVLFDVKSGNRLTEIGDELDVVLAADVRNDLSMVALGGPKKMVRVYSVADGSLLYEMKKHTDWINAIEFSPDGRFLATADRSAGLMIWEAAGGQEYQNLTGHTGAIHDLSWRRDSKILASGSEDGSLKLWNIDQGKMLRTWSANRGAWAVEFGMNGLILGGGRDGRVKVWDIEGKSLVEMEPHADMVLDAVMTYDGKRIVSGDWSGACTVFDATSGKRIGSLSLNPLPLEKRVIAAAEEAAAKKVDADAAAAEMEAARKALEAQTAAVKTAQDKANQIAADVPRLDQLRQKLEKEVPQLQKAAQAAAKQGGEAAAKAEQAAKDSGKRLADTQKALADARAQVKPSKDAADRAIAAKTAAEKTFAEKSAAAKLAADAAAAADKEAQQAAADKAEFDKLQNTQASVK